jgi:hypothetical protein
MEPTALVVGRKYHPSEENITRRKKISPVGRKYHQPEENITSRKGIFKNRKLCPYFLKK